MTTAPVGGELPEGSWVFMPLKLEQATMAYNPIHGCYVFIDGRWMLCIPMSHDPLSYQIDWYHCG